jgi:hypothetical protein
VHQRHARINDVALFRALQSNSNAVPDDELVAALRELASRSLRRRLAWLGVVARTVRSSRPPAVRAAALEALIGARGLHARAAIEFALDDEDPAVRETAVRVLRLLGVAEPSRWLVAIVHRRDDVRALAASRPPPVGAELCELPLLAHEEWRATVAARFSAWVKGAANPPAHGVPFVIDAAKRRWIERETAVEYISRIGADRLANWLANQPSRATPATLSAVDESSVEIADDLLELEWLSEPIDLDAVPSTLWWKLLTSTSDGTLKQRLAVAAWAVFKRHGYWSEGGFTAVCMFAPTTVKDIALSTHLLSCAFKTAVMSNGEMISDLLAARDFDAHHRVNRWRVEPLDESALVTLATSGFINGVTPIERIGALVGEGRLARAIEQHPEQGALLFCAPASSFEAQARLVAKISERSALRVLATKILAIGGLTSSRLVDLVGPEIALEALIANGSSDRESRPSTDGGTMLARRLGAAAIDALFALCVERERPPRQAVHWLAQAMDAQPADTLARVIAARATPLRKALATLEALAHDASIRTAIDLARTAAADIADDSARVAVDHAASMPVETRLTPDPAVPKPDDAALDDLSNLDDETLQSSLDPFLRWPVRGVAAALENREFPTPNATVCAALLRADDPPNTVARVLQLYWPSNSDEIQQLDELAAAHFAQRDDLSLLANAWMFRWERHAFAFVDAARRNGSIAQLLSTLDEWPEELAARAWAAATREIEISTTRPNDRSFDASEWKPVVDLAVDEMTGDDLPLVRDAAARLLVALSRSDKSRSLVDAVKPRAIAVRTQLPPARAALLGPWLDARVVKRVALSAEAKATRERVKALRAQATAEDAARLLDAGTCEQRLLLVHALAMEPPSPARATIIRLCASWTGALREALDEALGRLSVDVAVLIELARAGAGEREAVDRALERARADASTPQPTTLTSLFGALAGRELEASLALLGAACEATAHWTLDYVVSHADFAGTSLASESAWATLTRTVEDSLLRIPASAEHLRRRVARWLWARGIDTGFVVLAQQAITDNAADWLDTASIDHVLALVDAAIAAGPSVVDETAVIGLLRTPSLHPAIAAHAWSELLQGAAHNETRQAAINELNRTRVFRTARALKLRAIARTFAWGAQIGIGLTGRVMSLQLARDQALGYTRLDEDRIFVSALPMLRGEKFGRAVVEGLILHEFGHHRYHRGVEQRAAWDEGAHEGIGPLLNLVADEHLERNLRALDAEYGDRLKKLTAYAFQHMDRPIAIATLFEVLRGSMLEVLSSATVRFALDAETVVVEHGRLLQALEKSGSSFARWVRALRMGLGDRHNDEKVSRALELFSGVSFRKSTMRELLEIARKVRAIFGDECRLLGVCSTHENVGQGEPGDADRAAEGISDEEIRREVDRIVNPRKSEDDGMSAARPGGKRWINVTEETDFDLIHEVVRVRYEGTKHHALAKRVRRSAATLRRYLERLGLHLEPERLRLRGRRVDAPRTRALVTRGDPRVLIAREIQVQTDLFIGVVIDCSGSMSSGENMPRARLFGALIAEAARGMPSVDVRIFGFTDRVIYDAGDARCPAVHALEAGGGNNDAGALWHAANAARASRRRAKLLVMISDGLPTECSAASLKHLAQQLTRRHKMCCAQIAVQPLPEVLFPHYVECDGPDTDLAVRKFGRIVEGLVKRAMGVP